MLTVLITLFNARASRAKLREDFGQEGFVATPVQHQSALTLLFLNRPTGSRPVEYSPIFSGGTSRHGSEAADERLH